TFTSADGANVTKFFTVQAVADEVHEPNETFQVVLGGAAGATATGTILNDEPAPVFTVGSASGLEAGGPLTFTVTRTFSGGVTSAEAPQTVTFATVDGTARVVDNDYSPGTGTLTFTGSDTVQTFTVQVNDDSLFEGNEAFTVALSAPTGGAALGT